MLKLKYYLYLFLIILIVNFPNKLYSDNHNLNEIIELIKKDLKTLLI